MAEEKAEAAEVNPENETSVWIKADGKTEITINNAPANIAKAKELGWKKKK